MGTRVPPQNLEAEQSILGGLMLEKEAFDQVADVLEPDDFYSPANQKIYQVIRDLHAKNKPIDLVTATDLLQSRQEFDAIGGYVYLASLLEKTISAAHIATYAQIVKDKSLLRRLIHTSTEIIEKAYTSDQDVEILLDRAEADIFKVSEKKSNQGLTGSMEIVKDSIKKIEVLYQRQEDITGLATGFAELDKMTAGLHGGELLIVAARPSMGKTAFGLNLASYAALRQKKSVAFFSLEMSKESVMMRLLAAEAKVGLSEVRTGRVQDSSWPKLIAAASALSEAPMYIDDTSAISPFEIRARCRRLKAQQNLDMIMIDYLQLMDLKQKVESRERAVSEISKNLKMIAKELNVPVVAMAQLNRGVEGRSDRRPMLSDLRESGSIEQDADVIMLLYRDDYYDKDDPEKQGHAEIIIGKQRNGPTGTVKLRFDAKYNKFRDADSHVVSPLPPPQAPPHPGKPRNFAPSGNA
ncbi:MAG: replicative DNA helicase [Bdellovibrionota bacterium]